MQWTCLLYTSHRNTKLQDRCQRFRNVADLAEETVRAEVIDAWEQHAEHDDKRQRRAGEVYVYKRQELLCDATTAATSCPYCGNPSVLPGQFAGVLKPDFVLPFKLSNCLLYTSL